MKRGTLPSGGFTLLELMVAMSIAAVVSASLSTAVVQAARRWKSERENENNRQRACAILSRVGRDLREVFPFPGGGFEGSPEEMMFYAADRERIQRVTYRFTTKAGGIGFLERLRQSVAPVNDPAPEVSPLAEHPLRITWAFGRISDGGEEILWRRGWRKEDGYPLGVFLRVDVLSPDTAEPLASYRRVLDLTCGGGAG